MQVFEHAPTNATTGGNATSGRLSKYVGPHGRGNRATAVFHPGTACAAFLREEPIMQITIQGHQIEITPAMRDYTLGKFERIIHHFDQLHDISIVLGVEKLQHKAEATLQLSGKTLFAEAIASDMYAAIDDLVDKLDTQVRKYKEKVTDHHAESVRSARYG